MGAPDEATILTAERFAFEPHTAPYSNWTTSRTAARYIEKFLTLGRRAVYGFLYHRGPHANWQVHEKTGMKEKSVDGRRIELRDAGLVRDSGEKVLKDGLPTVLWEVVPNPDPETFEAYWEELERNKTLVRGKLLVTNCPRLRGEKKSPKKRELDFDAEALQALADALAGNRNPALYDLQELLTLAGFDPEIPGPSGPDLSFLDDI